MQSNAQGLEWCVGHQAVGAGGERWERLPEN